ncbi:hypothetical protein E2544_20150 [Achromobacter insolitus]|uniref:hypothetical protein n=1 Tax=Achromobacter insolitus TaxID=217204 RepID=UPI0011EAC87D|nr:hypothetical protein [Achromobacter insolitus]QEK93995.1 hypothetical protein E2544_20150 [Achromobacter insolitus]
MSRQSDIEVAIRQFMNTSANVKDQNQSIAAMVSFFLGMQMALKGKIPDEDLVKTAATLTGGRWASND